MNTKVAKKKNNKGFTLIELIVVIAIIAVLAAILAPQYLRYVEKSRITSDESTAKEINSAVQTACADSTVFENVSNGQTVIWNKGGKTLTGSATEVVKELNNNTFPNGTPAMKSKVWQQKAPYTVTITVTGDSVKISDNAPTVSGKTK